jgi:hypothetical protein
MRLRKRKSRPIRKLNALLMKLRSQQKNPRKHARSRRRQRSMLLKRLQKLRKKQPKPLSARLALLPLQLARPLKQL